MPQNQAERVISFRNSMRGGLCRVCASCHRRMFDSQVYNLNPEKQELLLDWPRILKRQASKATLKHYTHMCKSCYPSFNGYVDSVNYWRTMGHPRPEGVPMEDEVRNHEAGIRYEAWSRERYGQVWKGKVYENQIDLWLDMARKIQPQHPCKVCGKAPENVQKAAEMSPPKSLLQVDGEILGETENIHEWLKLSPQEVIKKAWNEGMCEEVYQLYRAVKNDSEESETSDSDDQADVSESDNDMVPGVRSTGPAEDSTASSDVESTDPSDQEFEIDGNNTKGLFLQVGNELVDLSLVRGMEDLAVSDVMKLKTEEESDAECECGETNCGCEEAELACGSDLY